MKLEAELVRGAKLAGALVVLAGAIWWGRDLANAPAELDALQEIVGLMQVQVAQQETFRRMYLCIEMGYTGEDVMTCPLMLEQMGEAGSVPAGAAARLRRP